MSALNSDKDIMVLPPIQYNKLTITLCDINVFNDSSKRSKNDKNNKTRETIIQLIINNKIPSEYYKYSLQWKKLKESIDLFIQNLCSNKKIELLTVTCVPKGGRLAHYDFKIIINGSIEFDIEFKYNASCVNDTPQFVSPMKPSQYLDGSYEEYYYDNYLVEACQKNNIPVPTKEEYLVQIHSPDPECVQLLQTKYYSGCKRSSKFSGDQNDIKFYEYMKKIAKDSIYNFISQYGVKKELLTKYLLNTQKNKYYMMYKDGLMNCETINLNNYIITDVVKDPKYCRYKATTKTGIQLKILLRWKNGNGIAYPAFQIS